MSAEYLNCEPITASAIQVYNEAAVRSYFPLLSSSPFLRPHPGFQANWQIFLTIRPLLPVQWLQTRDQAMTASHCQCSPACSQAAWHLPDEGQPSLLSV